ncbi:hypothetical protein BDN72DRAFT_774414, partial [Pluteus cervinus]
SPILFELIVNSRWYLRTSRMLFWTRSIPNGTDLFFFPKYTDGMDLDKIAKYTQSRFVQANQARLRLSVYLYITQTLDSTILRHDFEARTMLQNALKDSEILILGGVFLSFFSSFANVLFMSLASW